MKKRKLKKMYKRIKKMSMEELDKILEKTKIAIEKKKEGEEIAKMSPKELDANLKEITTVIEEKKKEEETK